MIKPCRRVLKGLRQLSSNSEDVLCFLENTTCICRYDDYNQTYDYSPYKKEINNIIQQLIDDGYLTSRYASSFSITLRGLHPYQFQWESLKKFLICSVFVPIFVSLVTTFIVIFLQG